MEGMPTASVTDLRRNTEALLQQAEQTPILITRYGKPAFVLMAAAHYKALSNAERDGL
jgi:prevent-host-death family protein